MPSLMEAYRIRYSTSTIGNRSPNKGDAMISMDDYRDATGRTDWKAYKAAQVAEGEVCRKCGRYIISIIHGALGGPNQCGECKSLDDTGEVDHHSWIRCPKCGDTWNPAEHEQYDVMGDGEHEVSCGSCGCDFSVSTFIEYTFTSPARETE